jgi:cysteine desulfurase / selenocysteine lyase
MTMTLTPSEAKTRQVFEAQLLDTAKIRADFPVLNQSANGHPLVYLDNGATTQKPNAVIDAISRFYREDNGTVRRGVYALSVRSTRLFDEAREKVAAFLNAKNANEIVFTRGTTDALNLVAYSASEAFLKPGHNVVISATEHHANIVPWQQACTRHQAELRVIPVLDNGELDLSVLPELIDSRTAIVSVGHVSNALGTIHPVKAIAQVAHAQGAIMVVDGAQGAPHMPVDVQDLDCDFYAFSGHKLYGPTGVGVLYGRYDVLNSLPPYQTGGDMINSVSFDGTTFAEAPRRFEAGTPMIAEVIGLAAAIDYVNAIGLEAVHRHETALLHYATQQLQDIPGIRILGQAREKASLVSLIVEGVHPHDIGTLLDEKGIAVRAGHHCAQPVMKRYGVPATTRASFAIYNTLDEVDALVAGLRGIQALFQ